MGKHFSDVFRFKAKEILAYMPDLRAAGVVSAAFDDGLGDNDQVEQGAVVAGQCVQHCAGLRKRSKLVIVNHQVSFLGAGQLIG